MKNIIRSAAEWSFYVFLFAAVLGLRKLVYQTTFGFDEYEAFHLYASDIALFVFFVVAYWRIGKEQVFGFFRLHRKELIALCVFVLFVAFSLGFADYKLLAAYKAGKLFLYILFALSLGVLIRERAIRAERMFGGIAAMGAAEGFLAFLQVALQKDLGLWFLGEPVLGPRIIGVSKVIIEGAAIIRGYGTFPHPNVLAAFLVCGLFSASFLFLKRRSDGIAGKLTGRDACIITLIFLILLGLIVSFSRMGWLVSGIVFAAFFLFSLWDARKRRLRIASSPILALLIVVVVLLSSLLTKFSWMLLPRASMLKSDPSMAYRLSYNDLALKLIRENPFGVGIGNQVIFSVENDKYREVEMRKSWEWQPIHNIYLLMAAEIGALGALGFLVFALQVLASEMFRFRKDQEALRGAESAAATAMLVSLLLFGLADHFLWTLAPGAIMLWLAIGLVMGLNNSGKRP